MGKTATTMRWAAAALLAGTLAGPGLALAHRDDDDGYHKHGRHCRHHPHGHHAHRGPDRKVVVVREPVYVQPPVRVITPVLSPIGVGITLVLHGGL
jgi:hypothetical protein